MVFDAVGMALARASAEHPRRDSAKGYDRVMRVRTGITTGSRLLRTVHSMRSQSMFVNSSQQTRKNATLPAGGGRQRSYTDAEVDVDDRLTMAVKEVAVDTARS